jgi:hypothetical protein
MVLGINSISMYLIKKSVCLLLHISNSISLARSDCLNAFNVFDVIVPPPPKPKYTLLTLLRDPAGLRVFEEHARKSFNAESVLFWAAVNDYALGITRDKRLDAQYWFVFLIH